MPHIVGWQTPQQQQQQQQQQQLQWKYFSDTRVFGGVHRSREAQGGVEEDK